MTRAIAFSEAITLESEDFDLLLRALVDDGYRVIGPRLRDAAVVYDDVSEVADFPIGYVDELDAGSYRLTKTDSPTLFGCLLSPQSWKRFLFPPALLLWKAQTEDHHIEIEKPDESTLPARPFAFVGVRSCDLHAIAVQDQVFLTGTYPDVTYKTRRDQAFLVVVQCSQPRATCFCASMNTGPVATDGFDLALTEVISESRHYFVVQSGSERGSEVMDHVPHHASTDEERHAAAQLLSGAGERMGRTLETRGLKEVLYRNAEHPQWESVAARCTSCGNCTMVCPTCFCTTVEDVTDLSGQQAEHWRKWDSCFSLDFSYIFGGSIRASSKSRYRQWATHKLASWTDQFGTSGCVGCGRCIAWCPFGIDITEEVRAIQASEPARTKRKG